MDFASYLPIIVIFLIIFAEAADVRRIFAAKRRKKKRGLHTMTNALIEKMIGKLCMLSTGSWGGGVLGIITSVTDNWVEVETKKGVRLVNADFVTDIAEMKKK